MIFFTGVSLAHSGRTDSKGGHYNRSTGKYHYHCGGHPEHQHANGVCPYKTTTKTVTVTKKPTEKPTSKPTNYSSGSLGKSTSSSLYSLTDSIITPIPQKSTRVVVQTTAPISLRLSEKKGKDNTSEIDYYVLSGAMIMVGIFFIWKRKKSQKEMYEQIVQSVEEHKKKEQEEKKKREEEHFSEITNSDMLPVEAENHVEPTATAAVMENMHEYHLAKAQMYHDRAEARRKKLDPLYGRSLRDISGMPANTIIGNDGYPRERFAKTYWGDSYTRYFNPKSERMHKISCHHCGPYARPVNWVAAVNGCFHSENTSRTFFFPCSVCCKDDNYSKALWYKKYLSAQKDFEKAMRKPLPDD